MSGPGAAGEPDAGLGIDDAGRSSPGSGGEGGTGVKVDGPETVAEERLLSSLRHRARSVNLSRVVRLRELLDSSEAGSLDEEGRREAENLAHQVVGSAGTFGSPAASRAAVTVEEYFAVRGQPGLRRRVVRAEAAGVRTTLERLRAEFEG